VNHGCPLCPTCHGKCCADKYDDRGKHIPEDDDGFIYWTHSCPDCSDGFAPALRDAVAAERAAVVAWLRNEERYRLANAIERGEHLRKENE